MNKLTQIMKGGAVKRYHTVTMIQEQTVAAHSWGVACVLLDVLTYPSAELLKAALYHDVAESMVGDCPATTKWRYPDLARELNKAEDEVESLLGVSCLLSDTEKQCLKFADMADLVLHCLKDYRLGNRDSLEIVNRGLAYLEDRIWPVECMQYLPEFKNYVKEQSK